MPKSLARNQKVKIVGTNLTGRIHGTGSYNNHAHDGSGEQFVYLVNLDDGFYSPDEQTYVSLLVVHADFVEGIE